MFTHFHEIFATARPINGMKYFYNIYQAIRTISTGLRITLPYFIARGVVVQYPNVKPVLQPRFRGFHSYQIERCIACEACAKICPVDCITVNKTARRKMDRTRDVAIGGAMTAYKIDHGICLFCGLCVEVCPTQCLKMGSLHDHSCYISDDLITDYIELAKAGRDKLTIVPSEGIAGFGDWVEQLIAESIGKEGRGIVPVVGEPLGSPDVYGDDRLFVHLRLDGDDSYDSAMRALEKAGHPVVCLRLHEPYDMGGQFVLWEMATAVAGHRLGINPFDQPNVEAAKVLARQMVAEYMEKGALPEEKPIQSGEGIQVYGDVEANSPTEVVGDFLKAQRAGAYVAIHAYLTPTADTDAALQALRVKLRDRLRLATTVGYGPRFLHSTGQLLKGDAGKGLFIQFTCDDATDVPIPDEAGSDSSAMTFGVLKAAQAMGDRKALMEAGRRVVRFHLGSDVLGGLGYLPEAF